MKIVVFDKETTGLGKDAYIVESCWKVYDEAGKSLKDTESHLIIPDGYDHMPRVVEDIHGISFEEARDNGKPKGWVLDKFMTDVECADYIVGHNVAFDKRMVDQELKRINMLFRWPQSICTMDIWKKRHPKQKSNLKLVYQTLFGKGFENAHRAEYDVGATARVLFEYHKRGWVEF